MTRHQKEVITGYAFLALNRAIFSVEDMEKVFDRLLSCFNRYDEAAAAHEGEYWLAAAERNLEYK